MTTGVSKFDRFVSIVATVGVLIALALLIEQRIRPQRNVAQGNRVELVPQWQEKIAPVAVTIDDTSRPVHVVVFTDFECPFCSRLDSALVQFDQRNPRMMRRSIIHLPLNGHRFAPIAAAHFQCAVEQDRAREMHTVLFARQQSFGLIPWDDMVSEAGVPDRSRYADCLEKRRGHEKIDAGIAYASSLGVNRTPVVMVNGWLFDPALPNTVESAILAVRKGRSPKP